jgi:hypothetical protein
VRLHEKGGKRHEMPTHHNLDAYIDAAGIRDAAKTPSFAAPVAAPAVSARTPCTAPMHGQ